MQWKTVSNVQRFWEISYVYLLSQESRYAQIISLIQTIEKKKIDGFCFWVLLDDKNCLGFAILNQKGDFDCSYVPPNMIKSLITNIQQTGISITRITAPSTTTEYFVTDYPDPCTLEMHQYIFECSTVMVPDSDGGRLIQAQQEHKDKVHSMLLGFLLDCFPDITNRDKIADRSLQEISAGNIYLWKNNIGEIVSMAAKVRETQNTTSISWVYTPKAHRSHGYGSKVTAYLSLLCIQQGKPFCNLLTDASNPTSNSIYKKIGYKQIGIQSIYQVHPSKTIV